MEWRIVDVGSLSAHDEQAWRSLRARAVEPNPFCEPDFLVPSAHHFEGFARTKLVIVHDGPVMRAVLPVVSTRRRRKPRPGRRGGARCGAEPGGVSR